MKNILIIEASPRSGLTKKYAEEFCKRVKEGMEANIEWIHLKDQTIELCRGCCACFLYGEEKCPLWGDAAADILEKMLWADGIVVFTPDYALQVPAILKNLFDRLSFVFHRPRLFGKVSMGFVTQGVYGGAKILKYMDELFGFWGCDPIKGVILPGALKVNEVFSDEILIGKEKKMNDGIKRFIKEMTHYRIRRPTLFRSTIFRMTRSSMKYFSNVSPADKAYFEKMGWFESDYYSSVKIGVVNQVTGAFFDRMIRNMAKKEAKKKGA